MKHVDNMKVIMSTLSDKTMTQAIRPIHPFPARMAPSIVWDALPVGGEQLRILDPMSGSGTTLVYAKKAGHHVVGCDMDPLALLISSAWCSDINPEEVINRAEVVLERAKSLFALNKYDYPVKTDEETRRYIDFWFDRNNRLQLTCLAKCIGNVRSIVEKKALWCAFSRMIITKDFGVSLARDVSHSRPHRSYSKAPITAFEYFMRAIRLVAGNAPFRHQSNNNKVEIIRGDARSIPVEELSIDMVITSPPYLNAIDYMRGHKMALVWMGYTISDLRTLRSDNIGSEVSTFSYGEDTRQIIYIMLDGASITNRMYGMIARYVEDMRMVMKECARVLKQQGRALFVVGDSTIKGVFIKNSELLKSMAKLNGMELVKRTVRKLEPTRRYLPPPCKINAGGQMQRRMLEEVILEFRKA